MKFDIEKKDLISVISKTQNIVDKRTSMPVLVNVLIEAENNLLTIYATDLEVSIIDQIKCNISTPGKIAVSAKSLFDILKELNEGSVTLNKKENNWLEIKQQKYSSKIVGVNAEEYPIFPNYSGDAFFKINSDLLKEMIDKTFYSVSNDETRYHLNGVYFEKQNSDYTMVATDGHRLSLIKKNIPNSINVPSQGVIIPKKGLNEIKKMIEGIDGELEIAIDGAQLIVRHLTTTLMVRLIEGKYPNYQQFIPQKLSQKLSINKNSFLQSLKRVSLLANQKSKAVTLSLTEGKMEIASNNPELGDAREELEINYSGKNMKIAFNAKYVQDILQSIHEENIDIELNDQLSPGLLRPHNDKNYTCIIMPMRI